MTSQPADAEGNHDTNSDVTKDADLDGPGPDLSADSDDDADSSGGDALGIDDDDPIDAELVGKPVDRDENEER